MVDQELEHWPLLDIPRAPMVHIDAEVFTRALTRSALGLVLLVLAWLPIICAGVWLYRRLHFH